MIRRTDSQGDVIHFFKIKDLQYFQDLLSSYDLSIVREFLQKNIEIVQLVPFESYHAEPGYRYIPSQNCTVFRGESQQPWRLKQGVPIESTTEEIVSKQVYTLYRISLKTEITLNQLYHLQIPIFSGLKCSEKLILYGKCDILKVDYGTYIYRKGDPVNAIYYVLDGQVKISKKRKEEFIEIATVQKGRMFGVYCLKRTKQIRDLLARSCQNDTRVLVIYRHVLDSLCKEKDTTIERLMEGVKSQLYRLIKTRSVKRRREDIQNEIKQNENTLERRIKGFEQERSIKNNLLQTLAQTKTLFVRVRNLNSSARCCSKEDNAGLLTNASDILTYTKEKSRKKQLKRVTEPALTPREKAEQSSSILRNFVGLTRYPSVQRYLNILSKEGQRLK